MNKNAKHPPMAKLAAVRKARKLSLRELGELTGHNRQTIYQYEKGVRSPSIPTLRKIAAVLNCSITDLIDEEEQTASN